MNKKTIIQSISRLEKSGMMKVTRSDKARISNAYSFPKCEGFQQIPYGIFDAEDLKYHQKAMLIFMRQLFDSYNLESFQCNLGYWADRLGISYRTLYTQYAKLIAKGYLEKVKRKSQSGHKQVIIRLTDKLNWRYYRSVPDRKPLFVEDPGPLLWKW
jgi:hypothetical protein